MPSWRKVITSGSDASLSNLVVTGGITGSLQGTASYALSALNASTASYFSGSITTAETASYVLPLRQDVLITGSLNISGSTTQIGNNTLLGNTTLSGSIIMSGSVTNPATPTIQVYGDMETDGVIKFMPVDKSIDTSISASYIFVSGSTDDLYFSQNGAGYSNVTRLRWLEGNLYTGLLHGGIITTQSSTVYQVSSGSGIIVNLNASLGDDPYPVVQYLNWGNLSASIAPLTASYQQAFVGIDATNNIFAQGTPFSNGQFDVIINIGNVLFQNQSTINGVKTQPSVAYGFEQQQNTFNRAFGPLKISGYTLAPSGSSTGSLIVGSGTAYAPGANYTIDPNEPYYVVDSGTNISKIFRYYQSGSTWIYNTNVGAGFTTIDPGRYSNNGVLATVQPNDWSIQRVFWFPNSVAKAIVVYYGNQSYSTEADAIANISIESFVEAPNTSANAIYLGSIIIRGNGVLTTPADFTIVPGGLFRQVGGSGGGGSIVTQTLSGLSDVNISGPTNGQPLVYNTTAAKWQNQSTLTATLIGNASTATTASYVLNAVSSSYSETASFVNPLRQDVIITGSLVVSASGGVNDFQVGANKLFVSTSGYVGIGTGSPTSKLNISGSTGFLNYDSDGVLDASRQSYLKVSTPSASATTAIVVNSGDHSLEFLTIGTGTTTAYGSSGDSAIYASSLVKNLNIVNGIGPGPDNIRFYAGQFVDSGFGADLHIQGNGVTRGYVGIGTASPNAKLDVSGSAIITGSLTVTAGITGSVFGTSSWAQNAVTASFATTAQTASYVLNAVSSSFARTASFLNTLNQDLTFNGNLTLNGTASISYLNVAFESASVIYSSGSNQLGDATNDTQTLIGTTVLSGSLQLTGSANLPSITGSLFGTASFAVSASNALTASVANLALSVGTLNQQLIVSGSSNNGTSLVQITQTGTGNALLVEDIANPDSTPFVIDTDGNVGIGTVTPTQKLDVIGNARVSGSLTVTQAIGANLTGSVFGTSSWSNNAVTASYIVTAQTASYVLNSVSSSFASTSQNANTASFVTTAQTASYVLNAVSASFATSASRSVSSSFATTAQTASYVLNAVTASFVTVSQTASFVTTAQTASYVLNSVSSSFASTASFVLNSVSSSFSTTASYVLNAVSSSFASTASFVNTLNQNLIITGSVAVTQNITASAFATTNALITSTATTINTGVTTIYNIPTASYDGAWFDYTVRSGSNARAGSIMGMWSGTAVNYAETTTTDFGNTSGFALGMSIVGANMILSSSATTNGWTFNAIIRSV